MNHGLPQTESIANTKVVVGGEVIHLVEGLQAYTIFLGNGVHGLALTDIVKTVFIVLGSFFLFFLQPDNFTLLQRVVAVTLVILGNFSVGNTYLLANSAEGVAATGVEVVVLVVNLDGVSYW